MVARLREGGGLDWNDCLCLLCLPIEACKRRKCDAKEMRRTHACSVVANVVSSAKGDLMNGVVVEEQLEQVVKVNCLYVKDVSQPPS